MRVDETLAVCNDGRDKLLKCDIYNNLIQYYFPQRETEAFGSGSYRL